MNKFLQVLLLCVFSTFIVYAQTGDDVHWNHGYGGPNAATFTLTHIDNYLYMGGTFSSVAGSVTHKNAARFNLTTKKWENMPGISQGHQGFIRVFFRDSKGTIWVGGDFDQIGGKVAKKIVKFNPQTDEWTAIPDNPTGAGTRAIVQVGDWIYLGGDFINDDLSLRYIRRININTNQWDKVGDGFNGPVNALAVDGDGNIYAGGSFTATPGPNGVPMKYLSKWDGTKWTDVGGGTNGIVNSLAIGNDGTLYVGGQFLQVGGTTTARLVASWDGSSWDDMGGGFTGPGAFLNVNDLKVQDNGNVVAGGDFTQESNSGKELVRVAVWNGSAWSALGSGLGNPGSSLHKVNALEVVGESVFVSGTFNEPWATTTDKTNFAEWNPNVNFVDIEDIAFMEALNVYPNPCSENTNIDLSIVESGVFDIHLYSPNGQLIKQIVNRELLLPGDYTYPLNTGNLPKGLYNLLIKTKEGIVQKNLLVQ